MKPLVALVCLPLLLAGCASDQPRASVTDTTSEPTAASDASSNLSPETASAVVSATAVAFETASARPAEPPMSEEQKFWSDLGLAFNSKLEKCKSGWTGDGEITVKDGKITKFVWLDISPKKTTETAVPNLKGTTMPAIPGTLKKLFEKPVAVSVCTASARSSNE